MINDEEITKLADAGYIDPCIPPSTIYHYTDASVINSILTADGIVLRMTRVSDFSDLYEGKSIEVYYDMALEELEREGVLSTHQRDLFNSVQLPEKRWMMFDLPPCGGQPRTLAKPSKVTPYIFCFSKQKCDPYMFENYLKNGKQGYCLEFFGLDTAENEITQIFGQGHRFQFYNVLYGDEIINDIKYYICDLLSCISKLDDNILEKCILGLVKGKLQELQYSAKLSKYKRETEVRLVLFMPKPDDSPTDYTPVYQEKEENGKSYVYISLPKYILRGLYANDKVTSQERKRLKQELLNKNYRVEVR